MQKNFGCQISAPDLTLTKPTVIRGQLTFVFKKLLTDLRPAFTFLDNRKVLKRPSLIFSDA